MNQMYTRAIALTMAMCCGVHGALAQAPAKPEPPKAPATKQPETNPAPKPGASQAKPTEPAKGPAAAVPPMVRVEPARIETRGVAGAAETRRVWPDSVLTSAWRASTAEAEATLIADYRTGISGRVSMRVERSVSVVLERLSEARVAVARVLPTADIKPGATTAATRVVVDLKRGRVRVTPPANGAVSVVTPEGLTVVREEAVVSHDAEHGTRVAVVKMASEGTK